MFVFQVNNHNVFETMSKFALISLKNNKNLHKFYVKFADYATTKTINIRIPEQTKIEYAGLVVMKFLDREAAYRHTS